MKRRGSILATAIAMTAVFLTLIVASMSFIESATRAAKSDRWREVAEEAARSGLDYVMGWAQQNIDRETKLPKDWENMTDTGAGSVINPVAMYARNATWRTSVAGIVADAKAGNGLGEILGGGGAGSVGEFVLAVNGNYVVTFKARIQQYRVSDSFPRQYRVGVVGRVRLAPKPNPLTGAITDDVDTDEKNSIVAERMLLTYVGKQPASQYAALIDTDLVRNWVPGEDVWGPVHINRGYVDDNSTTPSVRSAGVNIGDNVSAGGSLNIGGTSFEARNVRSVMLIQTHYNGALFDAVNGKNTPIFHEPVSMTAVTTNDSTKGVYTNLDNSTLSSAVRIVGSAGEQPYNSATVGALGNGITAGSIFLAPENAARAPFNTNGPIIYNKPVELPRSVRGALNTVLGCPIGYSVYDFRGWFNNVDDGVYVPTTNWWNQASPGTAPNNQAFNACAAGGIYIRGNVEIMRMGVSGNSSYYIFQLGYGGALSQRRTYVVVADRNNRTMQVIAFPVGSTINNIPSYNTAGFGLANITGAVNQPLAPTTALYTDFAINAGSYPGKTISVTMPASPVETSTLPGASAFPFNGAVFVDLSKTDPARQNAAPLDSPLQLMPNRTPLTGNIFSLGDPGPANGDHWTTNNNGFIPFVPSVGKRPMDGNRDERVATYVAGQPRGKASKLTIFSTGNIWIQNDIFLDSLIQPPNSFNPRTLTSNSVTLTDSHDLLGLVADKQVVVGLYAPHSAPAGTRGNPGCTVHASIAALGDPAYQYNGNTVDTTQLSGIPAYRGSFTTEGLMQVFNTPYAENYNVCYLTPGNLWNPANPTNYVFGSPLYVDCPPPPAEGAWNGSNQANINEPPGTNGIRGNLMVFGSITQRKRGIVGVSNRSYDKDFRFDRRLLTIAPPIFPSSVNVQVRSMMPITPTNLPYKGGAVGTADMAFMGM